MGHPGVFVLDTDRRGMDAGGYGGGLPGGYGGGMKPGDWSCPGCRDHQFARNLHCRKCGTPNPNLAGGLAGPPNFATGQNTAVAAAMPAGPSTVGDMAAAVVVPAATTPAGTDGSAVTVGTGMTRGTGPEHEDAATPPGPWSNEDDKPPSVLRAEIKALMIRNEFLENVANEQAQKIFGLEEQVRSNAMEVSAASERINIAESELARARACQARPGPADAQCGLVSLAATIVPGGPSSARELGASLLAAAGRGQENAHHVVALPPSANRPSTVAQALSSKKSSKPDKSDKDICYYFTHGGCTSGNKCKWQHERAATARPISQISQHLKDLTATHSASGPIVLNPRNHKADCWQLVNLGKCEYGDDCRFKHPDVRPA